MDKYIKTLIIYAEYSECLKKVLLTIPGWNYKETWIPGIFDLLNEEHDLCVEFVTKPNISRVISILGIRDKRKVYEINDVIRDNDGRYRMPLYDDILNKFCLEVNKTINEHRERGEIHGQIYCAVCPSEDKMNINWDLEEGAI